VLQCVVPGMISMIYSPPRVLLAVCTERGSHTLRATGACVAGFSESRPRNHYKGSISASLVLRFVTLRDEIQFKHKS
jgi:hypothetical protein